MFVVDALIANFDRHGYNWGFTKGSSGHKLAPIYDNGSSLFPRLQEEDIERILNDIEETEFISEKRKRFYKEMLRYRYSHIFHQEVR